MLCVPLKHFAQMERNGLRPPIGRDEALYLPMFQVRFGEQGIVRRDQVRQFHAGFQFKTPGSFYMPSKKNDILRLIVNRKDFDKITVAQKRGIRRRLILSFRREVEIRGHLFLVGLHSFHLHALEVTLEGYAAGHLDKIFKENRAF